MQREVLPTYEHSREHLATDKLKARDIRILDKLCDQRVVSKVVGGYKTGKFVGLLPLHSKSLEVLPKIFAVDQQEPQDLERNRRSLLHVLAFTGDLPIKESALANKSIEKHSFFEIIRYLFAKKLVDEFHKGMNRSYETFEDNKLFLTGRLEVAENVRENYVKKNRFYVSYDEFTEGNRLNEIFDYAVKSMICSAGKFSRRYLMELSSILSDIEFDSAILGNVDQVTKNRLNERFWPSLETARLLVRRQVPTIYSGHDVSTFSFLFNMEKLFEDFVARFLQKHKQGIFGSAVPDVERQKQMNFGDLSIKPDVIIKSDKKIIVLDTKYTDIPTEEDSKNSHLYQIYAYCMKQKQDNKNKEVVGLLLYPKHLNLEGENNQQVLKPVNIGREGDELSITVYLELLDLKVENPKSFSADFIDRFQRVFEQSLEERW